jgi:hypothetical protein
VPLPPRKRRELLTGVDEAVSLIEVVSVYVWGFISCIIIIAKSLLLMHPVILLCADLRYLVIYGCQLRHGRQDAVLGHELKVGSQRTLTPISFLESGVGSSRLEMEIVDQSSSSFD